MSSADGWNHNTHYHDALLSTVPRPCRDALDVGCGLGTFARRLTGVADHVDAIERDAAVLERARRLSNGARPPEFIEADFMAWETARRYDFVSMIATLHHLPFAEALARAAALLNPGGVLAVLGLSRAPLLEEVARSALAYPVSAYYRLTRRTSLVGAAILDPSMTLGEIRRGAIAVLPGATTARMWEPEPQVVYAWEKALA
jgi:trans-aconitate methyltransferase